MNLSELMNKWFDHARQTPQKHLFNDGREYINENISLKMTNSTLTQDVKDFVTIIGLRTSSEGTLDIYNGSLTQSPFFASFPLDMALQSDFHRHNYIELCYVIDGIFKQKINDTTIELHPGEICLMDKNSYHTESLSLNDSLTLFLAISDDYYHNFFTENNNLNNTQLFIRDAIISRKERYQFVRCIPRKQKRETEELLVNILLEINHPRAGTFSLLQGYIERFFSLIPSEYQVSLSPKEQFTMQALLYKDIENFISTHCHDISIQMLMDTFGYNRDYFNRLINQQTGVTYTQLVQEIRLKKAEHLLKTTHMPIEKIALCIGYSNIGYFYKLFSGKYQMTPKEYRKHHSISSKDKLPNLYS